MEKVVKLKSLKVILKDNGRSDHRINKQINDWYDITLRDGGHINGSMIDYFGKEVKVKDSKNFTGNSSTYRYRIAGTGWHLMDSWIDYGPDFSDIDACFQEIIDEL